MPDAFKQALGGISTKMETANTWFAQHGTLLIGFVIAAALVINLVVAAVSGVGIPLLLRRLGIDPALAGSVVLTTLTDVIGFAAFLGLGTLLLT